MFSPQEIQQAVVIQATAYRLLRWTVDAIERGFVRLDAAHGYASRAAAAAQWLHRHWEDFPTDCRPEHRGGDAFDRFTRYFATFLTTSFEIVEEPGLRRITLCGCYCELCSYLAAAPNLRVRKLTQRHRQSAQGLKRTHLTKLIGPVVGAGDADVVAELLLTDSEHSQDAAHVAYGAELLRRCEGFSQGPAVLALWREISWTGGGRRRDFELTAAAILDAEQRLLESAREAI